MLHNKCSGLGHPQQKCFRPAPLACGLNPKPEGKRVKGPRATKVASGGGTQGSSCGGRARTCSDPQTAGPSRSCTNRHRETPGTSQMQAPADQSASLSYSLHTSRCTIPIHCREPDKARKDLLQNDQRAPSFACIHPLVHCCKESCHYNWPDPC